MMMASLREGSTRRPGIIIHDAEATSSLRQELEALVVGIGDEINSNPPVKPNHKLGTQDVGVERNRRSLKKRF